MKINIHNQMKLIIKIINLLNYHKYLLVYNFKFLGIIMIGIFVFYKKVHYLYYHVNYKIN